MTVASELQSLNPSAKLEFFVVDMTELGGSVLYFHNGTNELNQAVVWQGTTYQYLPVQADGFEIRADGPRARPTLSVGDVFGLIAAELRLYDDLRGAKLLRKRMHARHLDAVNFAPPVNPTADPTAHYPDELWIFDRVASRDGVTVIWELTNPLDLDNVLIPARQVRNTICTSLYRTADCGYSGPPVAKADDTPTTDPALDRCSLRTSGCKLRFGANAELPIGIFPGAGVVQQL